MTRRPAVAGQFYPGSPEQLRAFLYDAVRTLPDLKPVVGVVSPHAGYVYSGKVAGAVYGQIEVPDVAVLLGPNHTGLGTRASLMARGAWATPLGHVSIDEDLADTLRQSCPILEEDSLAHAHEHSLEVQLPFLQYRNPRIRIVPITFMLESLAEVQEAAAGIADALSGWPGRVLLVASSDMTHYEPQERAKEKDDKAIAHVLRLDGEGLLDTTKRHKISMCGVIPTSVMLLASKRLGATRGELVAYATSGEVSGDHQSVVGYAGMIVY